MAAAKNVYIHTISIYYSLTTSIYRLGGGTTLSRPVFCQPASTACHPPPYHHITFVDHPRAKDKLVFVSGVYKRGFYRFSLQPSPLHPTLFPRKTSLSLILCPSRPSGYVYFIFDELSCCDKEDGQNISKAKGLPERFINKQPIFFLI
jgi:hypothetical protein